MTGARRWSLPAALALAAACLAGCGGSGTVAPPPGPPGAEIVEVGPLVIRPASTAGFIVTPLPTSLGLPSLVALHGAQIDYLASRAMLDRVVFASNRDGFFDIWVCNLDGSGPVQLTNNEATEGMPQWSPDGRRIVFQRTWSGQDAEIMTMDADGANVHAITDNTASDETPVWSPDGRAIAFQTDRAGNYEIYRVFQDGADPVNLTGNIAADMLPDWSRHPLQPQIAFSTTRAGGWEIYTMAQDGSNPVNASVSAGYDEVAPAWSPDCTMLACQALAFGEFEVFLMTSTGAARRNFSNDPSFDGAPCWSSDGRYVAFTTGRTGGRDIWLQEVDDPTRSYRVTSHYSSDTSPELGSPTVQTERVLIGPNGSDWGGGDPVWSSAAAGIVAFGEDGYLNFVRIGVAESHLASLDITPLEPANVGVTGALVEATAIANLKQDGGRGHEPITWSFGSPGAGAVALYFDNSEARLVGVLVLRDSAYPSAAGAASAVSQRTDRDRLIVAGDFAAVFDAAGNRIAGPCSQVAIGADGAVPVLE